MKSIFKALRKDHDTQREIFKLLIKTNGDSEERRSLTTLLELELKKHAKYEERYFYKSLLRSDFMQEKVRHSVSEHHEIDEKLSDLKDTAFDSPAWLPKLKDLKSCVEHHLDEEEHEIFQMAGKELNKTEIKSFSKQYQKAIQEDYADSMAR